MVKDDDYDVRLVQKLKCQGQITISMSKSLKICLSCFSHWSMFKKLKTSVDFRILDISEYADIQAISFL